MSRDLLRRLIEESPKLHHFRGEDVNWAVAPAVLEYLYDHLEPGMATLETGAGYSTIIFAIRRTNHICINPNKSECERICHYCEQLAVGSTAGIHFVHQFSEEYLPKANDLPSELDVVFIDGEHRFPIPAIDWHYTDSRLKIGGLLVVDDVNIPSIKGLDEFLRVEDQWDTLATIGHTAFFRKVAKVFFPGGWPEQKINEPFLRGIKPSLPRRVIGKLSRLVGAGRHSS
jgi:predicted O-methyltransferase YrrM